MEFIIRIKQWIQEKRCHTGNHRPLTIVFWGGEHYARCKTCKKYLSVINGSWEAIPDKLGEIAFKNWMKEE